MENQNKPVRKYYPKKSIIPTERDMSIECFLDRVGWANYEQIQRWLDAEGYEISIPVLRTRMSFMVKFGRLRSTRSLDSTYFALTKLSKRENELVGFLKHDRLPHENYIINLYLRLRVGMLLPREIRGQIKVGEKSGPIPDAIIFNNENDDLVHIEYERTPKSTVDVSRSIYNWLWSPRRHRSDCCVLVICESEQIFNR